MTITWHSVNDLLRERSEEICRVNKCEEDNHYCESFAYINANGDLLDICPPDFFAGYGKPYAAVSLPWNGPEEDLRAEVAEQIAEQEETTP